MLAISVQVLNGDTELCHLTTVPVYPDSVSSPLLLPRQIAAPPDTLPPTEVGSTDTDVATEKAVEQLPLCTTARNWVVCVNAPET